MDSTLLQYSFQVCPLFLNNISHLLLYPYHLTEEWTQHSSSTHSQVCPLFLNHISHLLLYPYHLKEQWTQHTASTHSRSVQYFSIIFPTYYYTRIISQSNGLNTPLVLILGLSTISQSYFPLITIPVSSHRAMDSTLLQYSFQVCPLFLNHISHLLLYPYDLTEQWTQHSSSPHSRSVHYFSIIFPTFTIRVSSHRAMDSKLLQYSFQVCPLFLKHISHLLLYPYHLTEQWTQHSSCTHSRSVHYFSIIFPTFTIPVSSHRAMDSTLLQSSFQVCPLFLNHISHLLLYPYHLTEQWTQHSSSTHSRSVHYFSIILPTFTIRVSSHRAMDSTLLQYSFQVCHYFSIIFPTYYYTRIISQSNGLNTPLVLILGLSTISQSYFPLITIPVSSHRAMDSTLLQYSFQVCPLFLNHISHLLLYPYHLTEQWTQHSSSTHSRSVHYFSIIFPTYYYTRIISQSNGLNTPLVLILGLSTISQSYFPLIIIPVSSHRAMDSTLLQYSFQVCPLFLNHISHLLLYPYHLTEQWTQHSSSTHSRSVHYFSIIFPTYYYTRIISQSNGLNTPLVLILGLSTISQSYFPLITIPVSSHRAMDSTLLQYSFQVCPLFLNHISHLLLYPYHLTEQWTQHSSSTHSRSVHYFLIILPTFTIRVSSHTAMDSTLLQYSFQVCPLFLNHIYHFSLYE